MQALARLALIFALTAGVACAEAPESSILPVLRPDNLAPLVQAAPQNDGTVVDTTRPLPRPVGLDSPSVAPDKGGLSEQVTGQKGEPMVAVHPKHRPKGLDTKLETIQEIVAETAPSKKSKKENAARKGSVCGDPAIRGVVLKRITSKVKGCGVAEPVQVTSIDGVQLSQAATLDCPTATALKTWIENGMRPAFGNRQVVGLDIAAHYICRPRNNIKGNKISEHGRGKAIDIAGFIFADGTEWTVLHDYNKQIRKAHKAACGIFGTTLGPGSDGYHENHLHFDTASYRSGSYCR